MIMRYLFYLQHIVATINIVTRPHRVIQKKGYRNVIITHPIYILNMGIHSSSVGVRSSWLFLI